MKPDIHPDYHDINVTMTDGSVFTTRSTYGKKGATLVLDIDPETHPAWTGQKMRLIEAGQLSKFRKRFKNFNLES